MIYGAFLRTNSLLIFLNLFKILKYFTSYPPSALQLLLIFIATETPNALLKIIFLKNFIARFPLVIM